LLNEDCARTWKEKKRKLDPFLIPIEKGKRSTYPLFKKKGRIGKKAQRLLKGREEKRTEIKIGERKKKKKLKRKKGVSWKIANVRAPEGEGREGTPRQLPWGKLEGKRSVLPILPTNNA